MLSKIPEEIFCGVFYSPPVLLDAFPQPPSFTSYGDQTLKWSKIHPTMVCLIESTNTCENAVIISTKGKGLKIVHFVFLFFRTFPKVHFCTSSVPANRLLYPQGMWSSNMLVLNLSSLAYRSVWPTPSYFVNINGWLDVVSLLSTRRSLLK